MKFFSCKYFSLLALACLMSAPLVASSYADDSAACCRSQCSDYVCGCNPLYCGAIDLEVHAGILPITWHDRGQFSFIQCGGVTGANPIVAFQDIPKYSTFFKLPWLVGGQVGLAVSDNVRVYLEFNYAQAKAKNSVALIGFGVSPNTIVFNLGKYKLYEIYAGARYYFDRWCERTSFFVGVKTGLVHHKRVRYSATITPPVPAVDLVVDQHLLNSNTAPSGGFDFGFDFCYCGNWAFEVVGGVIASCGPRGNNILFPGGCTAPVPDTPVPGLENFLVGGIGAELRFPVTVGVRYVF